MPVDFRIWKGTRFSTFLLMILAHCLKMHLVNRGECFHKDDTKPNANHPAAGERNSSCLYILIAVSYPNFPELSQQIESSFLGSFGFLPQPMDI